MAKGVGRIGDTGTGNGEGVMKGQEMDEITVDTLNAPPCPAEIPDTVVVKSGDYVSDPRTFVGIALESTPAAIRPDGTYGPITVAMGIPEKRRVVQVFWRRLNGRKW